MPLRTGVATLVSTHLEARSAIAVVAGSLSSTVARDSAVEVRLENTGGLGRDFVPEGVRILRDGHEVS